MFPQLVSSVFVCYISTVAVSFGFVC